METFQDIASLIVRVFRSVSREHGAAHGDEELEAVLIREERVPDPDDIWKQKLLREQQRQPAEGEVLRLDVLLLLRHRHTHTHAHTHSCWFLWFTGTLHRRNGFILYKLYVLLPYTYPTPKLSPHRRRCAFLLSPQNSPIT